MRQGLLPLFILNACAAACLSCSSKPTTTSPSPTPTPTPTPTANSLSGQVTDITIGSGISGATVSIPSGRNMGKSTITNSAGSFTLSGLEPPPSGLQEITIVSVSASNYAPQTKQVTFTSTPSSQTLSFQLVKGNNIITFNGLSGSLASYTESVFTVFAASGSWNIRSNYGNPAPFIEFIAAAGTTVTGEIRVTASGSTFSFSSVDLYSSTTTIPYQITGLRNSANVFTLSDTVPNTFGNFKTVTNPNAAAVIDTLSIVLTNPAAPCCQNPTGLDNIALSK